MEVTDGHELIGKCPYDLNFRCLERHMFQNISIPVIIEPVCVDTNLGVFQFDVSPQYDSDKSSFRIGNITVFSDKRVEIKWNFRDELVQFVEEQQLKETFSDCKENP